jgi:parallel beta-helix repeat protein
MNGRDGFDQLLLDVLTEDAPRVTPDRLVPETLRSLRDVRRRPRWLANLKEPPMRISSVVAAGSPTARLAALGAATILLVVLTTGVVVAGASLLAGDGPLVVDQDDPNAYQTISDAVAAAVDGDTILVRPGTYPESIAISSDITIQGDGERGSVVVQFAGDGPAHVEEGIFFTYGILLEDSSAHVANVTIHGPADRPSGTMSGVYVEGGAPVVEDVDIVLPGDRWNYAGGAYFRRSAIRVSGGSSATIRGSTWDSYVAIRGLPNTPTFEGNTITGQHIAVGGGGQQPTIARNTFLEGAAVRWDDTGSGGLVEENVFDGGFVGVDEGNDPTVRRNRISGGGDGNAGRFLGAGIGIAGGATTLVEGNEIQDSPVGILVTGEGAAPDIRGNSIRGSSDAAIRVDEGTSPSIVDNTIEDNTVGITVAEPSTATLSGNTFCGNEQDLSLPEGSGLTLEGNTVCEP